MRLKKDKWYVCIKDWSDDGWCKFREGDLVRCDNDDVMVDCYGTGHIFLEDNEPERTFREATETEYNIAKATEVNINEFIEDVNYFGTEDTLMDIYRRGAKDMLRHIRANLSVKK